MDTTPDAPSHYRKRPVVIEAIRYNPPHNCEEVWRFLGWAWPQDDMLLDGYHDDESCDENCPVYIVTLEGDMECSPGDYIIKGVQGEFYPCKPDIFDATYVPAEEGHDTMETKTLQDAERAEMQNRVEEMHVAWASAMEEIDRLRSIVKASVNLYDAADPSVSFYPSMRVTPEQSNTIARALLYGAE